MIVRFMMPLVVLLLLRVHLWVCACCMLVNRSGIAPWSRTATCGSLGTLRHSCLTLVLLSWDSSVPFRVYVDVGMWLLTVAASWTVGWFLQWVRYSALTLVVADSCMARFENLVDLV